MKSGETPGMSTTPKPTKVDEAVTIPVDDELIGSVLEDSDSSDSSDEEPEDSIEVMDDVESSSAAPQPGKLVEQKKKMKKICISLEPHPITETMNPCVRKKKNMVALKAPVKDVLKKLRLAEEQAAASVAPSTSAAIYICTYAITVVATTESVFLEPDRSADDYGHSDGKVPFGHHWATSAHTSRVKLYTYLH